MVGFAQTQPSNKLALMAQGRRGHDDPRPICVFVLELAPISDWGIAFSEFIARAGVGLDGAEEMDDATMQL